MKRSAIEAMKLCSSLLTALLLTPLTTLCADHAARTAVSPVIVVVSGAPCGIAAAITAAREGAKVILIKPSKHIDGLGGSGINTAESDQAAMKDGAKLTGFTLPECTKRTAK